MKWCIMPHSPGLDQFCEWYFYSDLMLYVLRHCFPLCLSSCGAKENSHQDFSFLMVIFSFHFWEFHVPNTGNLLPVRLVQLIYWEWKLKNNIQTLNNKSPSEIASIFLKDPQMNVNKLSEKGRLNDAQLQRCWDVNLQSWCQLAHTFNDSKRDLLDDSESLEFHQTQRKGKLPEEKLRDGCPLTSDSKSSGANLVTDPVWAVLLKELMDWRI